jgi:hypothetical protein
MQKPFLIFLLLLLIHYERCGQSLPVLSRTDLKINTSPRSLLEYNFKIRQENIFTPNQFLQNNTNSFTSTLNSRDFYYKQKLVFTYKLKESKVLQILAENAQNGLHQDFSFTPSLRDSNLFQKDIQQVYSGRYFTEIKGNFLDSYKGLKYSFQLGNTLENNLLQSAFQSYQGELPENLSLFENDLNYQKNTFFQKASIVYRWRRFSWSWQGKCDYLKQKLNNLVKNINLFRKDWLFELQGNMNYKVNSVAFWNFYYHYRPQTFPINYLYSEPIFVSVRSQRKSEVNLHLQRVQTFGTSYNHSDMYEQFLFQAGLNYFISQGNYFSNLNVQPFQTQIIYFFLPQNTYSTHAFLVTEKFFHKAHLLAKGSLKYTYSIYNNIVNNSDLRQNFLHLYETQIELKTSFIDNQ